MKNTSQFDIDLSVPQRRRPALPGGVLRALISSVGAEVWLLVILIGGLFLFAPA